MKKITPKSIWIRSIVVITGLTIFIAMGWSMYQRDASKTPIPPTTPTYRAAYHFTVPDKWKNDPQRPIYMDGKYHYYYLYNRDYPEKNGTEWRHATSTDLVHWKDEGVSIPKYTNPNGDPWSGSVVIDDNNSAGFGKGALVAIVTQPSANEGKQEQFLWYSNDNGKTFTSYGDTPVMKNPGTRDFRDPKIIRDMHSDKWIMVMAEGTKIGFYESDNLKKWRYMSGFSTGNIGLVECPDLYRMRADDGTYKWILGASANGKSTGEPNTYAYWTGNFDGNHFSPDHSKPEWLDYGFDWYGAVTFEEGKGSDKYSHRYALAWMNNWDYANNTPTLKEGFNGMDSVVRQIRLKHVDGLGYRLVSQPVEALKQLPASTKSFEQIKVNGTHTLPVKAEAYQLEADISWSTIKNAGLRLRESKDGKRHVDVGVSLEGQYSYVNRGYTGQPDQRGAYVESKAPFDVNHKNVHLKILVDKTSIEVFVDDGAVVHSSLIFPRSDDQGITLFADGSTAIFKNVVISNFMIK
ncbi:endolevanase, glycoside hydrolase family 32 [Paenibacillus terrae HPL-003]|uniref:Endolevanase, glycoside hydrolase family 32 n=1 Tax=Paenibacillus terrae (strain HPL-003) TaxID=985665 RepID=G7VYN6_PAETH|nr:glycoside hydrolase family 32 protein [Paenibacillus terrae]AET59026.1 endolevanase, glycoside hydrolase family 32 [Paenibacillus terrae HPL-003]